MWSALLSALLQITSVETHTVVPEAVLDEKAVFATVESVDVVGARARIGGVIGELLVDEGDAVAAGDIIAVVVDERLAPQIGAVNSIAAALTAQLEQARTDLARAQDLFDRGIFAQARLDEAQTAVDVLENQLASARQERAVLVQQTREGDVLSPTAGRILEVPVTAGSVVLPGETIAAVASELYVLRLMLPERHARSISEGDSVRVAGAELTGDVAATGFIRQVYPRIEDGRVVADAVVDGLGDYFVGERVRVLVGIEERLTIRIPAAYLETRYGVDYVRVRDADGGEQDVVVQTGERRGGRIEILAGLAAGDILVQP
ncbi:efflux RND transporter periplasmic adaptor subunit [Hyphobacterium sp.]|jgi:RND family efflux transporter MFP subunit|uniref:efflux RND transporter periplasmic adaptor subunit n=1 Tax=Hyphobacterium sp. TaxID=2004662 RepID=UPI003BA9DE43